jgi:hypothetical protein
MEMLLVHSVNRKREDIDMTKQVEKFPVDFVEARRGVQSSTFIDGCRAFPHKGGTQPGKGTRYMCSEAFRFTPKTDDPNKKVQPIMILNVHEQLEAPVAAQPAADTQPSAQRNDKRRDKKNRDNRGEGKPRHHDGKNRRGKSDGQGWRQYASASSAPKAEVNKQPATAADSFKRAKALLDYKPTGEVKLGNLRDVLSHGRAQDDATATGIRTGMSRMVARIKQLEDKLIDPMSIVRSLDESTRKLAEQLHHARKEREQLKKDQTALSTERLAALGKTGKALKAKGDQADPNEVAVFEAIKAGFAKRQAGLSAAIAANKELLDGKKPTEDDPSGTRGLEYRVLYANDIGGLMPEDEAMQARDNVMAAVADMFVIHAESQTLKGRLAGLVNAYEKRLSALA